MVSKASKTHKKIHRIGHLKILNNIPGPHSVLSSDQNGQMKIQAGRDLRSSSRVASCSKQDQL